MSQTNSVHITQIPHHPLTNASISTIQLSHGVARNVMSLTTLPSIPLRSKCLYSSECTMVKSSWMMPPKRELLLKAIISMIQLARTSWRLEMSLRSFFRTKSARTVLSFILSICTVAISGTWVGQMDRLVKKPTKNCYKPSIQSEGIHLYCLLCQLRDPLLEIPKDGVFGDGKPRPKVHGCFIGMPCLRNYAYIQSYYWPYASRSADDGGCRSEQPATCLACCI